MARWIFKLDGGHTRMADKFCFLQKWLFIGIMHNVIAPMTVYEQQPLSILSVVWSLRFLIEY